MVNNYFITHYTFNKLVQTIKYKIEDISLEQFLCLYNDKDIFSILNRNEIKELFLIKTILNQDNTQLEVEMLKYVEEKEDTKTYVNEKNDKFIFHMYEDCESMRNDFVDFIILPEIKENGLVEEYRDWFNSNNFYQKFMNGLSVNAIIFSYNQYFPVRYNLPILAENTKLVRVISNSDFKKIENTFLDIEKQINDLKNGYHQIFSCQVLRKLSKFSFLLGKSESEITSVLSESFDKDFVKNYGFYNVKTKLEWSAKIRSQIIKLISDNIKYKFQMNKDLNFVKINSQIDLNKFGLRCCVKCDLKYKYSCLELNQVE